jgi:hypothetical protein
LTREVCALGVGFTFCAACGSADSPNPSFSSGGAGGSAGAGAADTGGGTSGGNGGASGRGGASGSNGSGGMADAGPCFRATRLWFEDWETGDYSRWTSQTYGNEWGNDCQSNGFSTARAVSPTHSHRSRISCPYQSQDNVHRGYGGVQFRGDRPVADYDPDGENGIDAPNGIVNTFSVWLETSTTFENERWFSLWTVNGSCDWSEEVLTLGLEDRSNRLSAAHYQSGDGERNFEPNAPGLPLGEWVRITIYVNYHDETMHVWQNGTKISDVTFDRPGTTICQWHWGAYASGDNDDAVLFEDDNSIWKLEEAWTDFDREPWFGGTAPVCP